MDTLPSDWLSELQVLGRMHDALETPREQLSSRVRATTGVPARAEERDAGPMADELRV